MKDIMHVLRTGMAAVLPQWPRHLTFETAPCRLPRHDRLSRAELTTLFARELGQRSF